MPAFAAVALAAIAQRAVVRPAATPNTAAPGQIHFVPEAINVIAGGTNNSRADGDSGADGVPATQARLGQLSAMAVDSQGNLYLADTDASTVRRISAADGTISTVAGISRGSNPEARRAIKLPANHANVPGTQVTLSSPCALAVGPADELYIADGNNSVVYRLDATGDATIVAGTLGSYGHSPDGTQATSALLGEPCGLAVDSAGNLYISDEANEIVQKLTVSDGTLKTVAGNYASGSGYSGDGAAATAAQLESPMGLVLDRNGNLYIADSSNNVVRKVDAVTGFISTFAGNNRRGHSGDGGLATAARLANPTALALDAAGQLYISDTDNQEVRKVALDGTIATVAGSSTLR